MARTSSGIEPLFALAFVRHVLEGAKLLEVSPLFESAARARRIYSQELKAEIAKRGSIQEISGVPQDLKEIFVTALDIPQSSTCAFKQPSRSTPTMPSPRL